MFLPITNTKEASDKSRVKSFSCIKKIIPHVEPLIGNVAENVHIFSDGMSSQFRSRFVSLSDQNPIGKEYHMA